MKPGERVRAIEIDTADEDTSLEVGDTGIIVFEYEDNDGTNKYDLFRVKFDNEWKVPEDANNCWLDGAYDMFRYQLEVIVGDEE